MKCGHVNHLCPVKDVLARIADRWSILVLLKLEPKTLRFSELRRAIDGISQRMLARTVRRLEEDGLISRRVHPTVPPRVEYALTNLGRSLLVPFRVLVEWAEVNQPLIHEARAAAKKESIESRDDQSEEQPLDVEDSRALES